MNNLLTMLNPYMLLIKIFSGILLLASLYFAWHHFIAEPYREQGRAEIRPMLESANQTIKLLSDSVEKQNKDVSDLQIDSAKRLAIGLEAIKKAQLISLAQKNKITALTSQFGKLKTCDAAVDAAKAQL